MVCAIIVVKLGFSTLPFVEATDPGFTESDWLRTQPLAQVGSEVVRIP
jgi:hypothetical protein